MTFFYVAVHRSTVLLAALLMTVAAVVFLCAAPLIPSSARATISISR
ncbi:hypothetical protein [Saccharopolyspora sp. ASAGF58]|nr:hypothetical protein [Saccharopolyspora sp. ASAGF58]